MSVLVWLDDGGSKARDVDRRPRRRGRAEDCNGEGKGSLAEAKVGRNKAVVQRCFLCAGKTQKLAVGLVQAGRGEAEVCVSGKVGIGKKQKAEMGALRQARVNYLFLVWALSLSKTCTGQSWS